MTIANIESRIAVGAETTGTLDATGDLAANAQAGATSEGSLVGVSASAGTCVVRVHVAAEGGVRNLNGRQAHGIEYTAARNWARGEGALPAAEHEARFRSMLSNVKRASGTLRCFRGVALAARPAHCGPSPKPPTCDGRYNRVGETMLYMSDCVLGVLRELEAQPDPKWIQEFDVPLDLLNIADFVNLSEGEFINHVFFNAERTVWPDTDTTYAFSQRVARLVREHGFGGMIVRGARDGGYVNVVIFEPGARWQDWQVNAPRPAPALK